MATIRIEKLTHVVTVDDAFTILGDATIEITDGVITSIGPAVHEPLLTELRVRSTSCTLPPRLQPLLTEVRAASANAVMTDGKLALPGLVNLHTHLPR
jgi:cytosine/adenosine deaminase-related metal-dependent hydrolase